jgi:hypothetical protein
MVDRIALTVDDVTDDWPKLSRWDFPMVGTYDEFLSMVGDEVEAIGEFVQFPVWHSAPEGIKAGVERHYPELVPLFFRLEDYK